MPVDLVAPGNARRRVPGLDGIWVFVGADMVFFAVLFVSFMQARAAAPGLYEAGRATLNPTFGGINTLILLTSSWLVVQAVDAAKRGQAQALTRWLLGAVACGFAFGVSKAIEYGAKLHSGITPATSDFYMYYFTLTGFHLFHVFAGAVVLLAFWSMARRRALGAARIAWLECGATFWHMVDLLWIVLFPLLYLTRQ